MWPIATITVGLDKNEEKKKPFVRVEEVHQKLAEKLRPMNQQA